MLTLALELMSPQAGQSTYGWGVIVPVHLQAFATKL